MIGHPHRLAFLLLIGLLLFVVTTPILAEDDSAKKSPWEKFQFHGFLTQAYAQTDGEPYLGMTEDGTWDYRNVALQFQYEINDNNKVVFQLAHEALGQSQIEELRDDVELDWAFYEYRYHRGTGAVKVGRMPTPIGIYNEIRNVGTVLPFYSPPTFIYGQVLFNAETVDGLVLSNQFLPAKDWNLDLDVFVGEWEFLENNGGSGEIAVARAEDAVGGRLWVNTPILGLRFGAGGYTFHATEGLLRVEEKDRWTLYTASVDASLSPVWVRAEMLWGDVPVALGPFASSTATPQLWYVQVGWDATPKLKFALQYEEGNIDLNAPFPVPDTTSDDLAGSIRYSFLPEVMLRGEYHTGKNIFVDRPYSALTGEPLPEIDYFNISLAVSF